MREKFSTKIRQKIIALLEKTFDAHMKEFTPVFTIGPLVLQSLVDGPLASGDSVQVWPAAIVVFVLGAFEAAFIMARRASRTTLS